MTICSVPCTWYWKCGASHRSVPASGLTWSDQRHPGSRVSRPMSAPPTRSRSRVPRSKVRVSSGVPKLFCSACAVTAFPVMAVLLSQRSACRGAAVLGSFRPACPAVVAAGLQWGLWRAGPRGGLITCMKSLAVRVLGDFGVDGVEPQALGSGKARLALKLLALGDGQAVPSAVLTDALWGDTPPARPDDQLAVLVSRLRAVLGRDRIDHRDGGYLLRCDWLDAAELAALTHETDPPQRAGHAPGAGPAAPAARSRPPRPRPRPAPPPAG